MPSFQLTGPQFIQWLIPLNTLSLLFWTFIKVNLLSTSGPASVGLLYHEAVGRFVTESQFHHVDSRANMMVLMNVQWFIQRKSV